MQWLKDVITNNLKNTCHRTGKADKFHYLADMLDADRGCDQQQRPESYLHEINSVSTNQF